MHKMKKISLYTIVLFLLTINYGCEEYLFEESETNFTSNTLFETEEGLDKMVLALYDHERGRMNSGNSYLGAHLFGERTTDLSVFFTGADANLGRYTSPGPSSNIRGLLYSPFWSHRYYQIGRTNEIIHYGRELGSEAEAVVAEASFWRAYNYYGLYSRFSRLYLDTVPVTKDNLDDLSFTPASTEDIFRLLHSDLNRAIAGLGQTPRNNMTGRVTRATAHHLKALVAAWQEDWTTVAAHVDSVDADPNYSLVPNPDNIFNSSDLTTSETLFTLKFSNERGGGDGHRIGSQYTNAIAEEVYTQQPNARYNLENLGKQWALALPNSYLMSLYPENDLRLSAYYKRYYTYQNPDALITVPPAVMFTDTDTGIEFYTTTNLTDEPYQVQIGDTIYGRDVYMATGGTTRFLPRRILPSSLKQVDIWTKILDSDGSSANFKDIMVFRLAETFLLGAEANMHLGNQARAQYYYNKTWARAGNPDETGSVTFDMIRDEHARELAFEGRRFDFLKRTGIWYDQMRSYAGDFTKYPGSSSPFDASSYGVSDGRDPKSGPNPDYYFDMAGSDNDALCRFNVQPIHVNWPIPQDQIDAMGPENFPQTEGY